MHVVAKSLVASAVICAALALACQSSAPTATPRIQPEDIVVETRPTATPTESVTTTAITTTAPTTSLPAISTPVPTATPLPTEVSLPPSPTAPSRVATVTPNPTFEALRATATPLPTPSPTPDIAKLRERQVFRLPISNILVPDPVFADFGWSSELQYEIFAGLTAFTPDESNPVQLDMAASHSFSRDGLIHTFVLHDGLKFSDGSPVTASDFKWSWERALRTAAEVEVATQAEWVLAPILGASEVLAGEASELSGVAAVDETTLTVELSAPRSDLAALLAHPSAAVLKHENVEGWTINWSTRVAGQGFSLFAPISAIGDESLPVGTGPFTLTRFDEGNEIFIVERNNHYHGERPELDAVHFDAKALGQAFDDEDGLEAGIKKLFVSGKIDTSDLFGITGDSPIPHNLAPGAGNPGTTVLVFNPSIPPFDDLNFRRALAASIDRESILPPHGVDEATGIVAPESPGYSDASTLIAYDIDAAKTSFDAYTQANPATVDPIAWTYDFSGFWEAERAAIVARWTEVMSLEFKLSLESVDGYHQLRKSNKLPIVMLTHEATYPHPQSSVIDFRAIFGEAVVSDEIDEVDAMAQAAASEPDPVIALQRYAQLEQHLIDNALVVPLWAHLGVRYRVAVQPWVHGYQEGRYGGSRFKDVWFDETYPGPR